jgi:hypothetical protein
VIPVELSGVDGRNLLAFLTAVGTYVALDHKVKLIARLLGRSQAPVIGGENGSDAEPVRMSWNPATFRPTVYLPGPSVAAEKASAIQDCVIQVLQHALKDLARVDKILPWDNIKGISRQRFRDTALAPAARASRIQQKRSWADFVAGLGSDGAGSDKEIEYTALCAITGDSQQYFLGCMRDLRKQVTSGHLKDALFAPWKYKEEGRTFRWDPCEDRRYALRASDPSKGPDKGIPSMWGANRLAFEALACLPCFPRGRRLRTTAFEDERIIRWPLWSPPIGMATLRSVLAHPAVMQRDQGALGAMGVFIIASSQRSLLGRKRTFGPASLWPVPSWSDAVGIDRQ